MATRRVRNVLFLSWVHEKELLLVNSQSAALCTYVHIWFVNGFVLDRFGDRARYCLVERSLHVILISDRVCYYGGCVSFGLFR